MELADQLWPKVDQRGLDECWPFTGATNEHGYGVIHRRGRMLKAHRVAFRLRVGPIPAGHHVLHTCDNPPCCNPAHLYAGTRSDNMRDMVERKRRNTAVGVRNGRARLTAAAVAEARAGYTGRRGECKALCERFGVHENTMLAALHGRTWKDVPA